MNRSDNKKRKNKKRTINLVYIILIVDISQLIVSILMLTSR